MLSKELKQLLELSGGKIIVSDGELEKSYLVMRLEDYLKESLKNNELEAKAAEGPWEEVNAQAESLYKKGLEKRLANWEESELKELKRKEQEPSYEKIIN